MTLYLDTEFNGHGGELISLALVSDKGPHRFYGVVPYSAPTHPWVAEHVIPFLDQDAEPKSEFRMRLQMFLERYGEEGVIADWPDDFVHLMQAFSGPIYENSFMLPIDMRLIVSGDVRPEKPHNALSDAEALMRWHVATIASGRT